MPPASANDSLLSGIRRHLDGLKGTRDGAVLYNLIERGLKRYGETGQIERAFVNFITTLLGRYAKDPSYDAATRIKARLIQQRLALHLASAATATPVRPTSAPAPGTMQKVSARLAPGHDQPPVAYTPVRELAKPAVAHAVSAAKPESNAPPKTAAARQATPGPVRLSQDAEPTVAESIEILEERLVAGVAKTLSAAGDVAATIDKTPDEFDDLRNILIKGMDELIRERRALMRKMEGATEYLKALEADRRRLRDEVSQARKHSSVDELTGLPKRDIFVRNLEAEVGRVRRYGFAFALALLDVDGLGAINESYGRDAGDAVLRCYAAEILSHFRAYDLVSRYGDDEFAVLFPNTQKDGAMRALEKAQKSAATTYVAHEGRSIRLPTFSSVLTVYIQGEKPAQLLKRAAEALDHARVHGRNQIVVSLPSA